MAATHTIQVRLAKNQKDRLKILAEGAGFKTLSNYIRFMLLNPSIDMKLNRILEIVKDLQKKKSGLNSRPKSHSSNSSIHNFRKFFTDLI